MLPYSTYEEIAALSVPDSELIAVLDLGPKDIFASITLEDVRANARVLEEAIYIACPTLGVRETLKHIPMRDGFLSKIRVFQPRDVGAPPGPLIVLTHGGAFVSGSDIQYTQFARLFSEYHGATVINLSYRLAPEYKFPTAPNDIWDSLVWVTGNLVELCADASAGFIIGGASAGANLTLVTAQKWLDRKMSPGLTGVYAAVPLFVTDEIVPIEHKSLWFSREQNFEAPILNRDSMAYISQLYQPEVRSEDFSVLNTANPFANFPPTYIQVDGLDFIRDDGLLLDKMLRQHNVPTKVDIYPGMPHAHWNFFPQLAQSRTAVFDVIIGMAWLLKQELTQADQHAIKKFQNKIAGL